MCIKARGKAFLCKQNVTSTLLVTDIAWSYNDYHLYQVMLNTALDQWCSVQQLLRCPFLRMYHVWSWSKYLSLFDVLSTLCLFSTMHFYLSRLSLGPAGAFRMLQHNCRRWRMLQKAGTTSFRLQLLYYACVLYCNSTIILITSVWVISGHG